MRSIEFFRFPTFRVGHSKAKGRRGLRKDSEALHFRREEGDNLVTVPTATLDVRCRDGVPVRMILRIGSRKEHVNFFRDTRKHVTAQRRRQLTRMLKHARLMHGDLPLEVVINCTGGATAVARGYALALKRWRGEKHCTIDGECSSAATLIAFLPRWEITVTPKSTMQIHRCKITRYKKQIVRVFKNSALVNTFERWVETTAGTAKANKTSTRDFETLYHRRTGRPRAQIRAWMEAGTRFTAPAMCAFGFADEMRDEKSGDHSPPGITGTAAPRTR